jgi:glucose-1-phosphate thymidylyltransferase
MVLLANRPLIHYALDKLVEIGVTDIGIVVGDNEDELRRDLAYPGAQLTFIRQPEPKGLAHAVSFAREFTGDDDFILLFCDNLFSISLHDSLEEWNGRDPQCECLLHVHQVDDPRAFGVAVVEGGWVSALEEKPQQPRSNLAIVGIDFFTPRIYDAIARIEPSFRGELEITDAIAELLTLGYKVRAREIGGYWYDTGTFRDLLTAQAAVLDGKVDVPEGTLQGSTLGANVAVGAGASVSGCELADCMVYPGTQLRGVTASGAIFDGTTRIDVG